MEFAPFFLTGAPKSGTTWLAKLLDAHPQVNCRGEACMHHFGLELVKACNSYRELLAARKKAVTESNDFPDLLWADVLALMRRFVELRLQAIADPAKPDLKFLGEKDPEHAMHLSSLDRLFPAARFIHIIRDVRGVFVSAQHHNLRAKDETLARLSAEEFLDLTAREWTDRVRRARLAGAQLGARYFQVRYEDLAGDPASWMARTLDFLGADSAPATVQACLESASFEKLSRGRRPGQEDASSFFRKGDPEEWKTRLEPSQIRRFALLCGAELQAHGYPA